MPSDKQYLITRNVPCPRRITDLYKNQELIPDKELAGNWLIASCISTSNNDKIEELAIDIDAEEEKTRKAKADIKEQTEVQEEIKDLNELEEQGQNVFVAEPKAEAQEV